MSDHNADRQLSRLLLSRGGPDFDRAPARLKSRLYSALIREQQKNGPLMGLKETEAAGHELCAWERLMRSAPIGERGQQFFHCQTCHARLLAEHFERVCVSWTNCPYVAFQKR